MLLALAVLTLGSVVWFGIGYSMLSETDALLDQRLASMVEFIEADLADEDEEFRSSQTAVDELGEILGEYALAVTEGHLIEVRSPTGARIAPVAGEHSLVEWFSEPRIETVTVNGTQYRVRNDSVEIIGETFKVQVASSLESLARTRSLLLWWLFWALLLGMPILAAGGYFISRRALKPVDELVALAANVDVGNLEERLPVVESGDVIQRLTDTFNGMLGRIASSVGRLEQFTADASHELRSPVTVIRTTAELAVRQPSSEESLRSDLSDIVAESRRLARLLDDLFTLARGDNGAEALPRELVQIDRVVRDASERFRNRTNGLRIDLCIQDQGCEVLGHEPSLLRLFSALLDNALRYTGAQRVKVSVESEGDEVVVSVTDGGPGIRPAEREKIFDRFYQADPSRNGVSRGSGLGLPIAQHIADLHGTKITVSSQVGRGATFFVRFSRLAQSAA